MLVVTNTGRTFERFGYEKGIKLLKQGGFLNLDLSLFHHMKNNYELFAGDDWEEKCEEILKFAKAEGVAFRQAHAPYGSNGKTEEETARIYKRIVRAIKVAGKMGCKCIIVHPKTYSDNTNHWDENKSFFESLIPYAKEANVKVAVENMWGYDDKRCYITRNSFSFAEELKAFVNEINSEWIVTCLDLGHSALVGREPEDEIKILGDSLFALHVHDTDYKDDLHAIPFQGRQNWQEICQALKEVGYKGDFTFEVGPVFALSPEELYIDTLKYMYRVGEYLAGKCE